MKGKHQNGNSGGAQASKNKNNGNNSSRHDPQQQQQGPKKKRQEQEAPRNNTDATNDSNKHDTSAKGSSSSEGHVDPKLTRPDPWARELDFTDLLYTPHTLLCLCLILATLLAMLLRYQFDPNDTSAAAAATKIKLGLSAAAFVFVGFSAVHLPDSLMVRPHPSVWRAVLALGILYLLFLTFMLFQDLPTVRQIAVFVDPTLAQTLPQQQYAADCRISTPEKPYLFFETAFDSFILAHALGYTVKTLIMRDWRLVTCVSLGFEVVEVTFQHVLPNFRECWWDHLILDVLLCNAGGTVVGMYLLQLLRAKRYEWIALREIPTIGGKARRVLGQFGPRTFVAYDWNVFVSAKRFLQATGIVALMLLQEFNCFTMKSVLNMHQHNPLVLGRLALWAALAGPALREYYEFFTNPAVHRVGATAWVTTLGLAVETVWIGKMCVEGHYFASPAMPLHIIVPWMVAIPSFAVWVALFFGCLTREQRCGPRRWRHLRYHVVNVFFYLAVGSVLALFCMGLPDLQIGRERFEAAVAPYAAHLLFWRHKSAA